MNRGRPRGARLRAPGERAFTWRGLAAVRTYPANVGVPTRMDAPYEFLNAKLRGRRRRVYEGGRLEELARHGYTISPGTLYPTLHSLERAGYLTSEKCMVEGRWRRYYTLTPSGETALAEARARLAELVAEVLETPET